MNDLFRPVRAIKFPAIGAVSVIRAAGPAPPGPGEVLVGAEFLGICGTDLHVLHGQHPWVRPPLIIGHECVATVLAAGEAVGFAPEARVVLNPLVTCGHCRACRSGHPNHCATAKVIGFRLPGAGRTRFVVSAAQLHAVPAGLDPRLAVLAEPLAVGIHAAGLAADLDRILVIGSGTIGLCVLLALRAQGAGAITVVEPIAEKRLLALRLGAHAAIAPDQVGETAEFTTVFDCVAAPATLDAACRMTLGGGAVVVVGVAEAARQIDLPRMQRFEIDLFGSGMYVPADIDAALAALTTRMIDAAPLISAVRPLDGAQAAYAEAMRPDSVKVLIDMR